MSRNSVSDSNLVSVLSRSVDAFQRPAGYALSVDGTNRAAVAFGYDSHGRVGSLVVTNDAGRVLAVAYTNAAGRNVGYAVTLPVGAVFRREVVRDPAFPDRVLSCSNFLGSAALTGFAYEYDPLDRPVRRNDDRFAYDTRGQVTAAVLRASSPNAVPAGYAYDLAGNRVFSSGAGGIGMTWTANALNQCVAEGSFADNLGNVMAYVDESGTKVASYTYDAFGQTVSSTGPMREVFPHRFSTKWHDDYLGMVDYGRRWYHPRMQSLPISIWLIKLIVKNRFLQMRHWLS